MSAKERSPNRLISEASMYLRQHAHNPVDWFAWGQEALNKAKTEDKPIMLSIGYSACHWCHVMEKESFEDEATAILLNTGFVNIKVDREERPEIDQIYQTVVQLMGRSGGWPLTVFLTPDQKPFFAGTYFPPVRRYGMPAFSEILNAVRDAFDNRREEVEQQGHELAIAIAEVSDPARAKSRKNASVLFDSPTSRKHTILDQVAPHLWRRFDDAHGGFGTRPKFPNSMNLELLLRHSVVTGDNESAKKVKKALNSMRRGGIWDHLGGGFHRYSTDEHWLVPHFEKMLYDNALLLRLYHDAARVFSDDSYLSVAKDIADYLLREMKSAGGAFYATQDADSEGEEGKFFVWTVEQICSEITDTIDQKIALSFFGVESGGNFEHTGATVLSQSCEEKELAEQLGLTANEVNSRLRAIRAKLFETREHREKPLRDEKMLACWNGLLIGALAELGATTRQEYIEAAKEAFAYIEQRLIEGGRVARYATETGYVAKPGFLDDHASIANAALDLYEVTGEPHYSEVAKQIADTILNRFTDNRGGFFVAADDHETLVCRIKDGYDSATPSGTSLALRLLRRLASLYGQPYADIVKTQATALSAAALESAMGFGQLLLELDLIERGPIDIVIVGNNPADFLRLALQQYLPERTIAWVDPNNNQTINAAPELTRDKTVANGTTGAFVCRDFACSKPVYSPAELSTLLKRLRQNQRTDDCFGAGQALSSKYPAEGIPRPWLNRDQ